MLGELGQQISKNTLELIGGADIAGQSLLGMPGNVRGADMAAMGLPIQAPTPAPVYSFQPKPQPPGQRLG